MAVLLYGFYINVVALGSSHFVYNNPISSSTRPASAPGPTGLFYLISFSPDGIAIWTETYQRPVFVIVSFLFFLFNSFPLLVHITISILSSCCPLTADAYCANCILGPTVVNSGSALTSRYPTWQ